MFNKGKHQSTKSIALNLLTNKNILLGLLAAAIVAILIPTISFAAEVLDAEGETLPEKVENAINEIIGEPATAPAAANADMSNYLCFTPEGSSATFQFGPDYSPPGKIINKVEYSVNEGSSWIELNLQEDITITGPTYIRSYNPDGFNTDDRSYVFTIDETNKIKASGNVMSLIDNGEGTLLSIKSIPYCFQYLFSWCTGLLTPPDLPATTLSSDCYCCMFRGCTNLSVAPELPAIEVSDGSYYRMFEDCESLEEPPALPATKLGDWCYLWMFSGCSALRTAPELPALNLVDSCYSSMFEDCTSLTKAPYLPAETLVERCYDEMFKNCESLQEVSVGFSIWNDVGLGSTSNWLANVSNTGVFKCPKALPTTRDASHVPQNWTVQYFVSAKVEGYNNVYDGQEHGITITPIDPEEISIEYSRDGSSWGPNPVIEKNVGEYEVYYRLSAENYVTVEGSAMIIITPKTDASASFVGAPYSKMYGDKDPDFKINFQGFLPVDTPKLYEDYTIFRESGEDVNADGTTYRVIFNWLNPNYTILSMETTLTINKTNKYRLVCDNVSKVYYEPDPTSFTAHMEGLKFDDELTSTDYEIEKTPTNANPTTYKLKPKFSSSVSDRIKNNYVIDDGSCFVEGTYKVYENPASFEFQFMVNTYDSYYDGQDHEFSINVKNPTSGAKVQYKKEGEADWHDDPCSFKDAGTYNIYYRLTHDSCDPLEDSATLNIQKAPATVVPNACSKNEGEADPALTAKVYGLVDGESLQPGEDYILQRQPGETPGMYDIYCTPADSEVANNYDLTGADSKFFIASAGGAGTQGAGSSVAQTGDANAAIFITIAIIGLASAGYILSRKYRWFK